MPQSLGTRFSASQPPHRTLHDLDPSVLSLDLADRTLNLDLAVSVLNLEPKGIILTDERCRVVLINRSAERILFEHDGLRLHQDFVVATSSDETQALRRLVGNVVRSAHSNQAKRCAAMTISRPSFQRSYEIVVVGLKVERLLHRSAVMVAAMLIGQQYVEAGTVEQVIADLYGLTPTESRMAAKMMRGASLSQVASELEIKRETARTHLKNIFSKTQTNRQSELVRLLVTGPANVCLRQ